LSPFIALTTPPLLAWSSTETVDGFAHNEASNQRDDHVPAPAGNAPGEALRRPLDVVRTFSLHARA
jgi:hypothetical protein